jgi:hypothetical protein
MINGVLPENIDESHQRNHVEWVKEYEDSVKYTNPDLD